MVLVQSLPAQRVIGQWRTVRINILHEFIRRLIGQTLQLLKGKSCHGRSFAPRRHGGKGTLNFYRDVRARLQAFIGVAQQFTERLQNDFPHKFSEFLGCQVSDF